MVATSGKGGKYCKTLELSVFSDYLHAENDQHVTNLYGL
jgi:hypothetical protein